ncbi:MAG: VWA domain-containing protein [Bacteroidia bacterium]|nr:VWA domain-containing protein [Bacteroidia bacterium]
MITKSSKEYSSILESLEIPIKKLSLKSKKTPEIEVLDEIKNYFDIPHDLETRNEIESYLVENVRLDDFFGFIITLIQPFIKMLTEIYAFLNSQKYSVGKAKSVVQLRIGSDVTFPIDLSNMPREWQKIIDNIDVNIWNVDILLTIQKELEYSYSIVACDGKSNDNRKCRPDCLKQCKEKCMLITKQLEKIIIADSRIIGNNKEKNVNLDDISQTKNEKERYNKHPQSLPLEFKKVIETFISIYNKNSKYSGKAISDCLPGQRYDNPEQLWAINRLDKILKVLSESCSSYTSKHEYIKEFLKLPYWRYRNDLYELWILVKVCQCFHPYQIAINNITDDGCWCLPGNGQGDLSNPILYIDTSSGRLSVYTGVKFSNFMFSFEKKGNSTGAMPDWIFCRNITPNESFDFSLFAGEANKFSSRRLIPELIIECKAGASYHLLKTLEDTISCRYTPLLRNEDGRCFLVNYRSFTLPKELVKYPLLKKMIEYRYSNVSVIDELAPGSKRESEFEQKLITFFDRFKNNNESTVDIVFAIDTTGSMHEIFSNVQTTLINYIQDIVKINDKARIGIIAIGDHDKNHPDPYFIKPYAFSNNINVIIDILGNLELTNGGDAPEAYEDALSFISNLNWSNHATKVVVFIGDSYPHPNSDCPNNIDWEKQVKYLAEKGVKIYGIQTKRSEYSDQFFEHMCSNTKGKYVYLNSSSKDEIYNILKKLTNDYMG